MKRVVLLTMLCLVPMLIYGQVDQQNFGTTVPPGTLNGGCPANDETCLSNVFLNASTNLNIFIPSSQVFSSNFVRLTNVNHINVGCSQGTSVSAKSGFALPRLFLIEGAARDVIFDGKCLADGTNLADSGNNAAVIEVQDLQMTAAAGGLTQGAGNPAPCPTTAGLICFTATAPVANFANINSSGDVNAFIWNSNPGDWNSGVDLSNCDVMKCPAVGTGPITFYDSTHFGFTTDSNGNPNAIIGPAYIAGAVANIGPKRIEIDNLEVANSPREGIYVHSQAPYPTVRDVTVRGTKLHDNSTGANGGTNPHTNNGARFLKTLNAVFELNQCTDEVSAQVCVQMQSDINSKARFNNSKKKALPVGTCPTPTQQFLFTFSIGAQVIGNQTSGSSSKGCNSNFRPDFYFDTGLNGTFTGNTCYGGFQCGMWEVSQGMTIQAQSFDAGGDAFTARYRSEDWTLYSFNAITTAESHVVLSSSPVTITAQPPKAGTNAGCTGAVCAVLAQSTQVAPPATTNNRAQGDAGPIPGVTYTAGMLVTPAATVPQGAVLFYVDLPRTDSGITVAGNGTNAQVCNGTTCVITTSTNPITAGFTTTPANGGGTNSVTITGASTTVGTHTLTAVSATSITFASTLNATSNNSDTITQNITLRQDWISRHLMFYGCFAGDTCATISGGVLGFAMSSQLGLVNPETVIPMPHTAPASQWGPQKIFLDDEYSVKTSEVQSMGVICIVAAGCGGTKPFTVSGLEMDIFDNESNSFDILATRPGRSALHIIGGHHLSISLQAFDPGYGSNLGTIGVGTGLLLEASDSLSTPGQSPATPIDNVQINKLQVTTTDSNTQNDIGVFALKATCDRLGGATGQAANISNIFVGPNGVYYNDFFAGNAISLPPNCAGAAGHGTITNVVMTPQTVAQFDNSAQAAVNGPTNLQCGGTICPLGTYQVQGCVFVTTAGTAGTLTLTIGWTDPLGATTAAITTPAITGTSRTCFGSGTNPPLIIRSTGAAQITHQLTFNAVTVGTLQFGEDLTLTQQTIQ